MSSLASRALLRTAGCRGRLATASYASDLTRLGLGCSGGSARPAGYLGADMAVGVGASVVAVPGVCVTVRHFGRKGGRMGHHLETLDEMAHRGSHADAKEKRKNKKGKKGKGGGSDEGDAAEAAPPTASMVGDDDDVTLEMEEDESETKFDHGSDDDEALLPEASDVKARMMKVVSSMEESFKAIRGAEPTPELFESIQVDAYGTTTPLSSVAQVVIVGPTRATLTCYDPGTANDVRDAVRDAGLNLNPAVEEGGGVVVVPIPRVSMETRERLAKQIGKAAESGRQRVRRIRRAAQDMVKKGKDGKLSGVGEDDAFRAGKDIDAVTDEAIAALNGVAEKKQENIMAV